MTAALSITRLSLVFAYLCLCVGMSFPAAFLRMLGIRFDYYLVKYWGMISCAIFGIKIIKEGENNTAESAIIASTHVSYWDIMALASVFNGFFVSKDNVKKWPVLGIGASMVRTIFINRGSKKNAVIELKKQTDRVFSKGESLIMFPEGTTSGAPCQPFKNGAFHMAFKINAPVKPVALCYSDLNAVKWIGDDSLIPNLVKLSRLRGLKCLIYELPHIYPSDFSSPREMAVRCQHLVQEKIDYLLKN